MVVRALEALGVRHVFGIVSVHNLPIFSALADSDRITAVNMRHEQAAVTAADGYARATGRLGVALTSTGPGAANAMGGLFEAGFASSRVLMITGQVESRFYGQGRSFLHEAEGQQAMLRSVLRDVVSVGRTVDIGAAVTRAAASVLTGRPQPAAVEIPVDLQYAEDEMPPPADAAPPAAGLDDARLRRAAELLAAAERPLLWSGGGVVSGGAEDELRGLAEALDIPVVTSVEGRGALPEDHPLCVGPLANVPDVRDLVVDADVVLAVGTRFQMLPTGRWTARPSGDLIHLDADPSMINRTYPAALGIVADAKAGLAGILRHAAAGARTDHEKWNRRAADASAAAKERLRAQIGPDHRAMYEAVRRHLPADGNIVRDATVPAYSWGDRLLPVLRPRTSMRPVSAAIGPGLPLAIGASTASGTRTVLIQGDGGFMLSVGELAAVAQYAMPITICVFNDRGYGVLRRIEDATYGRNHDVDLATPKFAELAETFGIASRRVATAAAFEGAFAESVARPGPTLIEVDITEMAPISYPTGGGVPEWDRLAPTE
jgi:acetolactate synthase-1/2/3 large subunit